MKLESFKDKKVTRRKMILISLGIITIVGVTLLLYKTFASFSSEVSFPMMSGKVNYYGNADLIFAFYNGDQELDEMPQKGNLDNLVFDYGTCDNEATIEWNNEKWAPLVKGLNKTKTRCTLYFSEYVPKPSDEICNGKEESGACYIAKKADIESEEPELMYDDTNDKNLRYVGATPNNYIDIGDKTSDGQPILWRIIGVMKNVYNAESGSEEDLIKIIRADSIGTYSWDTSASGVNDGDGVNEWSQADIMKLLNPEIVYTKEGEIGNSLYWNSGSGQCYSMYNNGNKTCDFTSSGISEEARNKLAKVRWNTGTFATYNSSKWTASATYQAERSENNGKQYCTSQGGGDRCNDEVDRTTTWDGYIGLVNPSDFGYAVGKSVRETCLAKSMDDYSNDGCKEANWLTSSSYEWTLNPVPNSSGADVVFCLSGGGYLGKGNYARIAYGVRPVGYLKSNTTISDALGTKENPFVAS